MIYDVIGIGFGPANIALAIALEEEDFSGSRLFLERNPGPGWQENMQLAGSDIQNHPLRDLVTPANPRSRYSFTNFLYEHDRLFEYLNLGITYPLREEYSQYVRWVAGYFAPIVRYGVQVETIALEENPDAEGIPCFVVSTPSGDFRARSVVLAPGRSPNIPAVFEPLQGARVFHLTEYTSRIEALAPQLAVAGAVAVIGASQSAVEIVLDLETRFPDIEVHSVIRSYGFRLKDTSPFSDEIYFPEFVDYYFNASPTSKARLHEELRYTNYSSVDDDVLHKLYMTRYQHRLRGLERVFVHQNSEITAVAAGDGRIAVDLTHQITGQRSTLKLDAVVMGTGFKNFGRGRKEELVHPLLENVSRHLAVDAVSGVAINRDYTVRSANGATALPLFLNGLCESTHGFGDAGSFSLLALRAREISAGLQKVVRASRHREVDRA